MLEAYAVSRQLIRTLAPIVPRIAKHDRELTNQLTRAANSILLNIGEGQKRAGGDVRRFFQIASGSASEVRAVLDAAEAWGWSVEDREARQVLDRLLGLLYGLVHGPRSRRVGADSAP